MRSQSNSRLIRPVAIVQARMGSTRLPGKVLRPILGKPMLARVVERLRFVSGIADIVVATSDQPGDEPIRQFCRSNGIGCFSGNEQDVLDRFYRTAVQFSGDPLIRVTGDCPLVDPELVSELLELFASDEYDHVGLATGAGALFEDRRFPRGLDAECTRLGALEKAWREATEASDREHVTPYLWRVPGRFCLGILRPKEDYSNLRWTVDHEADFRLICQIYEALYREDTPFVMADVLRFLASRPHLIAQNQTFVGREGDSRLWAPAGISKES